MSLLLFVHIFGAFLFLGNIVTAAFWKIRADVTGNPVVIHRAAQNVMIADYAFTLPGLVLLTVSGIGMAVRTGALQSGFNWLALSLVLFAVTGALWLGILIPLQRSMIRHSKQSIEAGAVTEPYRRASRYWAVFGTITTLLPVVILYFMVAKSF
ncbi:DUF2269 family protein [Paenibacillus sp. GYB003]|uniref:DUF2269 family protein n=1 Tax=Paenibacillus sp. GYB003 TaxID=2994392 RepID=UPI002F961F4B